MTPRRPTGRRGSNQYQTRPGHSAASGTRADTTGAARAAGFDETPARTAAELGAQLKWEAEQVPWFEWTPQRRLPSSESFTDADWDTIAADPHEQYEAARAPHCPRRLLDTFTDDPDPQIRRALAHNPACPPEIHSRLLDDPDDLVRDNAVENPVCPTESLVHAMNHDRSEWVRFSARTALKKRHVI